MVGTYVMLLGIVLVFLGVLISIAESGIPRGDASVGGVIMLGPIPLVFGDKNLALLSLAVGILLALIFWITK